MLWIQFFIHKKLKKNILVKIILKCNFWTIKKKLVDHLVGSSKCQTTNEEKWKQIWAKKLKFLIRFEVFFEWFPKLCSFQLTCGQIWSCARRITGWTGDLIGQNVGGKVITDSTNVSGTWTNLVSAGSGRSWRSWGLNNVSIILTGRFTTTQSD